MVKIVPPNVIKRLPKYLYCLRALEKKEVTKVSSAQIAQKMGTTASQVRQDLSIFGRYGSQGYGYSITNLAREIEVILGIDRPHNIAIVGVGSIGKALLSHMEFEKYHYQVVAAFDIDPDLIGTTINGVKIYSMDEFKTVLSQTSIDICMLTVSKENARNVGRQLYNFAVPAIWNFTNENLKLEDLDIVVQNVNLQDSLFELTYYYENESWLENRT